MSRTRPRSSGTSGTVFWAADSKISPRSNSERRCNVRIDGRQYDEMRKVNITRNFIDTADGSVLIELGKTRVICTASIEEKVPLFLKDQNRGWITAEYSMIP